MVTSDISVYVFLDYIMEDEKKKGRKGMKGADFQARSQSAHRSVTFLFARDSRIQVFFDLCHFDTEKTTKGPFLSHFAFLAFIGISFVAMGTLLLP